MLCFFIWNVVFTRALFPRMYPRYQLYPLKNDDHVRTSLGNARSRCSCTRAFSPRFPYLSIYLSTVSLYEYVRLRPGVRLCACWPVRGWSRLRARPALRWHLMNENETLTHITLGEVRESLERAL